MINTMGGMRSIPPSMEGIVITHRNIFTNMYKHLDSMHTNSHTQRYTDVQILTDTH